MDSLLSPPTSAASDEAIAQAALDAAFNNVDPLETPPELSAPPVARQPDPAPQPETPAPAEPTVEEPAAASDGLDAPPEGVALPKPTNKDLRSQLVARNAEFTKLEGEKKLVDDEVSRLKLEVEKYKKLSEDVPVNDNYDVRQAPEVKRYADLISRDRDAVSRAMGKTGKVFRDNFERYFKEYVAASAQPGEQGDLAMDGLIEKLEAELGEDGRRDAMSMLGRNLPNYEMALQEMKRLEGDVHNRRTRQSVEKYTTVEKEIQALLDPLGDVPESVMAAKPHSVEAYVSKLLASDSKWHAFAQKAKQEIKEVLAGVKPLSPEELAKLEANDTGELTGIHAERETQFKNRRANLARRAFYGTMILTMVPKMLEELETLRAANSDEDDELDALSNVPVSTPPAKKQDEVPDFGQSIMDAFRGQ